MRLLKFTERNDWEGETWNFYIWMDSDTESRLRNSLKMSGAGSYSLSKNEYTEEQVEKLMGRESRSTYMDDHNLCGVLHLPDSISFDDEDPFYKGGIEKMCTPKTDA